MSKKFLSVALASAMVMAMSVSAFATTSDPLNQSTEVSGSTEAPTLIITVPTTNTVIVNPYQMTVQDAGGTDVTDQIVSATNYVKNASDVAIKVKATVTGKPAGEAVFATSSNAGKAVTTKSVFMYLDTGAATKDDGTGDPTWSTAYDSKSTAQILVGAKATSKELGVMGVGDTTATFLAYRLTGDAATTPTKAWTDADKVDVTIAFTFTPTVAPAGN